MNRILMALALGIGSLLAGCEKADPAVSLAPGEAVPDSFALTPVGSVVTAWLDAFASGDPARMRAFDDAHGGGGPRMAEMGGFRAQTGGFSLLRVEEFSPRSATVLLQERMSDLVARATLAVSDDDPPRLSEASFLIVPRPPELAIARLTESEALEALARRATELAAANEWSGAVLVARGDSVLLAHAAGQADRRAGVPVSRTTRFRIGSMNKMFTAVATLQLVADGRLSLDDPLGKVLPDYPNREIATGVTIRHLLTHTGGTGDFFGPEFEKNRATLRTHSDYLELFGERGPTHRPGAEHRYSNYGFILLGAIIERVTGMSYYDYVQAHVFAPAGMASTGSLPEAEAVAGRSEGYMRQNGAWVSNAATLPWRGTAAGGGYSTVDDLFRFASALRAGTLIPDSLLAEATKVQEGAYGYGMGIDGEGALRSYGHGGGAPGMNGDLRIYPELGYVVVALANLDPPAASRLVQYFTNRMPTAP